MVYSCSMKMFTESLSFLQGSKYLNKNQPSECQLCIMSDKMFYGKLPIFWVDTVCNDWQCVLCIITNFWVDINIMTDCVLCLKWPISLASIDHFKPREHYTLCILFNYSYRNTSVINICSIGVYKGKKSIILFVTINIIAFVIF